MNPTQAEADAVARALLATVPEPPRIGRGKVTIGGRTFDVTGYVVRDGQGLVVTDWRPLRDLARQQLRPDAGDLTADSVARAREDLARLPAFLRPIPKMELGRLMDAALQIAARRMRTYPDGCTCPKLPANGTPQTYNLDCPIKGHQRLALAARHRRC